MPHSINWCIKILNFKVLRLSYWTSYHPERLLWRRALRIRSSASIWKIGTCWCWPATKIDISWIVILLSLSLSNIKVLCPNHGKTTMEAIYNTSVFNVASVDSFRLTSTMLRSLTNLPAWCWSQPDLNKENSWVLEVDKFKIVRGSYSWWLLGTLARWISVLISCTWL